MKLIKLIKSLKIDLTVNYFLSDWEYPANRGGSSADKENYIKLLADLKEAFQPKGFLLTAAVSAGFWTIDTAYNIPMVSKYL